MLFVCSASACGDYAVKAAAANGVRQPAATITTSTTTTTLTDGGTADTGKTTGKTTGKLHSALSEQEKNIVKFIKKNPAVSQREIAAKIGLSEDGVRYHTDKLKKKGILRRIGGAKGGHWEIAVQE